MFDNFKAYFEKYQMALSISHFNILWVFFFMHVIPKLCFIFIFIWDWNCSYSYRKESKVTQSCLTLCNTQRLQPTRILCLWDFPGKNTGVGCHFFLYGIFPTQGLNPGLPHCGQTLYHLSHQGIPASTFRQTKPKNSEVSQGVVS